jgi:uncharacterized MAPEG superfamily protein
MITMSDYGVAHWCLLIGGLMPYFLVAIAKSSRDYDNENPRNMAGFTTPARQRAHGAHSNALEGFGFFAVAVLLATIRRAPPATVDALALLWIVLRLAYAWTYIAGKGTARSLLWFAASFTTIAVFLVALLH